MSPAQRSAGILLYRFAGDQLEVLVAHPGGPLWAKRDAGWWSIPKGLVEPGEDEEAAARREFAEETGTEVAGPFIDLGSVTLKSGKIVRAFGAAGDLDPAAIVSNTFPLEWPPKSGKMIEVPEIDQVRWCSPAAAKRLLNPAQIPLVDRLLVACGLA